MAMRRAFLEVSMLTCAVGILGWQVYEARFRQEAAVPRPGRLVAIAAHLPVHPTGIPLRRGWSGEAVAFIDADCPACGSIYESFIQAAAEDQLNLAYSLVPLVPAGSAKAELKAMAVHCAGVEERDQRAFEAILVQHVDPKDLQSFGNMLRLKNVPDFISCVKRGRFRYELEHQRRIADSLDVHGTIVRVSAPPRIAQEVNLAGVTTVLAREP